MFAIFTDDIDHEYEGLMINSFTEARIICIKIHMKSGDSLRIRPTIRNNFGEFDIGNICFMIEK